MHLAKIFGDNRSLLGMAMLVKVEVSKYIEKQKSPQREICQKLRGIILAAHPAISEEIKWGVPTYGNGKYYIVALKDHVNLGFSLKGLSKDEQASLEGSGKKMKHIKIRSVEEIDEKRIIELLRLVWKST